MLSQAKKAHSDYLKSGKMNGEVTKSTILLAQLDTYFRAGIIDENFGIIDDGDVADLKKLIALVNPDSFKARELCLLNPTFGEASLLIGGADTEYFPVLVLKLRDKFNRSTGQAGCAG